MASRYEDVFVEAKGVRARARREHLTPGGATAASCLCYIYAGSRL